MSEAGAVPPGWYADPRSRFEHRYWDGNAWTDSVSTQGVQSMDSVATESTLLADQSAVVTSSTTAVVAKSSPSVTTDWPPARIIAILGAALLALGSVLPWASVSLGILSRSINGTEGDGVITLIAGLLAGILFLLCSRNAMLGVVFAILAAAVGLATAGYDLINVSRVASNNSSPLVDVSAGVGLYICVAGGLAAVFAGLIYASSTPSR